MIFSPLLKLMYIIHLNVFVGVDSTSTKPSFDELLEVSPPPQPSQSEQPKASVDAAIDANGNGVGADAVGSILSALYVRLPALRVLSTFIYC